MAWPRCQLLGWCGAGRRSGFPMAPLRGRYGTAKGGAGVSAPLSGYAPSAVAQGCFNYTHQGQSADTKTEIGSENTRPRGTGCYVGCCRSDYTQMGPVTDTRMAIFAAGRARKGNWPPPSRRGAFRHSPTAARQQSLTPYRSAKPPHGQVSKPAARRSSPLILPRTPGRICD